MHRSVRLSVTSTSRQESVRCDAEAVRASRGGAGSRPPAPETVAVPAATDTEDEDAGPIDVDPPSEGRGSGGPSRSSAKLGRVI